MVIENEYNLYYCNEFIGTYTTRELAKRFNITTGTVTEYGRIKKKYKKNYEWHPIYHATKKPFNKKTLELMEERDRLTARFKEKR